MNIKMLILPLAKAFLIVFIFLCFTIHGRAQEVIVPAACKGEWKLEKADIRKIVAAGDTVKLDYDTIKFATYPFFIFQDMIFSDKDCHFYINKFKVIPCEIDFGETEKMKFGFSGHGETIEFKYEIKRNNRLILTRLFDMYDIKTEKTYPVSTVLTYRRL